jgi:hypothetical protein
MNLKMKKMTLKMTYFFCFGHYLTNYLYIKITFTRHTSKVCEVIGTKVDLLFNRKFPKVCAAMYV